MKQDTDCVAKVVITWKSNILLLQRVDGKGWELPGGHLNLNETFIKGAKREVYEETGMKLGKMKVLLKQKKFCLFHIPAKILAVKLSNEHNSYRWASKGMMLKSMKLTKATHLNMDKILDCVE